MTREELMKKIIVNIVPESWYCIDSGLKQDALHLYKNYTKWEYFYLDERGSHNDFRIFYSDEEAFDFLWEKIEGQLLVFKSKQ